MRDWSMFNYDILGEVALKLDTLWEFVYFSAVCRSWRHAASLVKRNWKPLTPCLLLAETLEQNPDHIRNMFSLDNNRCYRLSLPETYGSRCWGSACGWVVTINLGRQIHVLNPFTQARFELPPQPTLPSQDPPHDNPDEFAKHDRKYSIRKAIVVKSVGRGHDDDFIVLAIIANWKRFLAYARPADQTWTPIVSAWPFVKIPSDVPFSHRVADVVCRDQLILILYEDASIGYIEISDLSRSTSFQKSVKAKEFLPSTDALRDHIISKHLSEMYLVDSFGYLLMVLRNKKTHWELNSDVEEKECYKTDRFEVIRFDNEIKKWEQSKELGDVALFLGNSQSISVRASDCRNCKSNCIYFTDDCDEFWSFPEMLGGHDMGVYNLENGEFRKFYEGDDMHSDFCTPFWFMPQIYFQNKVSNRAKCD